MALWTKINHCAVLRLGLSVVIQAALLSALPVLREVVRLRVWVDHSGQVLRLLLLPAQAQGLAWAVRLARGLAQLPGG